MPEEKLAKIGITMKLSHVPVFVKRRADELAGEMYILAHTFSQDYQDMHTISLETLRSLAAESAIATDCLLELVTILEAHEKEKTDD